MEELNVKAMIDEVNKEVESLLNADKFEVDGLLTEDANILNEVEGIKEVKA